MTEITENVIRDIFGDTTFFRGLDYYNHGHVSNPVKIDDILYSQVMGSSARPYEVRAFIVAITVSEAAKSPEEGVTLCRMKINEDILRSHVHYDKAMFLLTTIRDIYASKGNEAKWVEFIKRFASENKGKKKLIEMMRIRYDLITWNLAFPQLKPEACLPC